MDEPVDLNHPALLPADLDLVQQVALRLVLAAAHRQRLSDVLDVLLAGQLRHACTKQHGSQTEGVSETRGGVLIVTRSCTSHQHHGEEDDEQVGVMPKSQVSLHTHILEEERQRKHTAECVGMRC